MTVGREFIFKLKEQAPHAFDARAPADANCVFVDGQLKLPCPKGMDCWDQFFRCLFRQCIQGYLRMPGVTTVVIGFDDSLHSPLSKGPTQAARREKTQHITWPPCKPLPPTIPANYAQLLMNREFKSRVIAYVIARIEDSCPLVRAGTQRIIIDYQNEPYVAVGSRAAAAPAAAAPAASATAASATAKPPMKRCLTMAGITAEAKSPTKRCLTMTGITADAPPAPSKKKRCATEMDDMRARGGAAPSDAVLDAAVRALDFEMGVGPPLQDSAAPVAAAKQEVFVGASPEEFRTGYVIPNTVPLGECDVKFVRYLSPKKYGNIILDAVDSDYVIIGMCQVERLGLACPRIFVRRITIHLAAEVEEKAKKPVGDKNRGFDFFPAPGHRYPTLPAAAHAVHANESSPGVPKVDASAPPKAKRAGREYEYVDCGAVVAAVTKTLGARTSAHLKPYTVRLLAFVVALCGCDFTRGLMFINGTVINKSTSLIWSAVCAAASVDAATGALVMDERLVAEGVVGTLWKRVLFPKLKIDLGMGFEALFELLTRTASIAQSRRDRLATPGALGCLVRNCNWTVFYWADPERCPCAVHGGDYGFVLEALPEGSQRKTQVVKHDNDRPLGRGASVSAARAPLAAK